MDEHHQREVSNGLRQGCVAAWHDLYDEYARPVWQAVARLLGPGSSDVADVVQETFLAAALSARGYDPSRGSLRLWLMGIAHNHVAIHYRTRGRQDRVRHAAECLAGTCPQVDRWLENREAEPPDALDETETAALVRAALAELPNEYGLLLEAKYLDETSVEQIAADHRSTVEAIRSKLARARRAFRESFSKIGG